MTVLPVYTEFCFADNRTNDWQGTFKMYLEITFCNISGIFVTIFVSEIAGVVC